MNRAPSPDQLYTSWKDLYVAALFESDKPKIAERIAEAQGAILARKRNLTISVADVRERHALDNALFSLEALRTCLSILPPVPAASLQHHVTG
jgi:hypothetical protein